MVIISQCIQVSNHYVHTRNKYNVTCQLYLNFFKKTGATDSLFLFSGTTWALPCPKNIPLGKKRCMCVCVCVCVCARAREHMWHVGAGGWME